MTATTTVDTTATTVESTTVEATVDTKTKPEAKAEAKVSDVLPTFEEFIGVLKTREAIDLLCEIKALSESEATKRIDKLNTGEVTSLLPVMLAAESRKVLTTKLGETTGKHLIHTVCTKVQLVSYEADDTARAQSLKAGEEGWGVYAQQAPLGGFGAEIGFVRQEKTDGKFTTQRGAAGFYLRASDEARPVTDSNAYQKGADALAALIG